MKASQIEIINNFIHLLTTFSGYLLGIHFIRFSILNMTSGDRNLSRLLTLHSFNWPLAHFHFRHKRTTLIIATNHVHQLPSSLLHSLRAKWSHWRTRPRSQSVALWHHSVTVSRSVAPAVSQRDFSRSPTVHSLHCSHAMNVSFRRSSVLSSYRNLNS